MGGGGGAARRIREEEWRLEKAAACHPRPFLGTARVTAHTPGPPRPPGPPGRGLELVFSFGRVHGSSIQEQQHGHTQMLRGRDPLLPSVPVASSKDPLFLPLGRQDPNTPESTVSLARHLSMPGAVPSIWVICNRRNLEIKFVSVEDGLNKLQTRHRQCTGPSYRHEQVMELRLLVRLISNYKLQDANIV